MKELIRLFECHAVNYALVGGYAVGYHGYVRMTQDIDFLLRPSVANAARVRSCLTDFGFGQAGIPFEIFELEGGAVHLGVEPNRIDLLTSLHGVDNDSIFAHLQRAVIDGVALWIIDRDDLITVKRCSARLRDQADAEELDRFRNDGL